MMILGDDLKLKTQSTITKRCGLEVGKLDHKVFAVTVSVTGIYLLTVSILAAAFTVITRETEI